jgi:glycosyltransferase involved in cell wall biosynthesis
LVLEVNAPLWDEATAHRGRSISDGDLERERFVLQSAARVACVSSAVARYVASRGVGAERIAVRPNGVDARRFVPRAESCALRDRLGLDGRFVLGFHGRLRPWHRFDALVDAAAALVARGRAVHVLAIGEGEFERELERLPRDARTWIPWLAHDEVAAHVACYDALALTYRGADCYFSPLKLLEAMACGAVAVVPRAGDLETIVEHEFNGLTYAAGDADALLVELERAIDDRELCARLAREGRRTAEQRSWTSIAAEVLDLARGARAR